MQKKTVWRIVGNLIGLGFFWLFWVKVDFNEEFIYLAILLCSTVYFGSTVLSRVDSIPYASIGRIIRGMYAGALFGNLYAYDTPLFWVFIVIALVVEGLLRFLTRNQSTS